MPWTYLKGRVCEIFGWKFTEFDEQPADEVLQYLNLRGIYEQIAMRKKPTSSDD